jgi:thiol-disulfide isomerase/thioredoxin
MKRLLFLLPVILIYSGCKEKNSFTVQGNIKGEKSGYVYLNHLDLDTPVFVDSAKIKSNGNFKFRIKASEPDFYQVCLSNTNFITILAEPGEKIKLSFSKKELYDNYTVTGSEGSAKLRELDQSLVDTKRKLDSLVAVYNKASGEPGFETKGPALDASYVELVKAQRKKNIEFIIKNTTSLAAIKALYQRLDEDTYVLYDPKDLQYLKIVTDSLKKYHPSSRHVQALSRDFEKEMQIINANLLGKLSENLEPAKLNPDLKNTEGKRISLESLRGKYVLVTFWSVQSKDCVAENLQLKELYKIYNKKGFEIYQINLDADEKIWKSAVKFDELPWISVREDDPANPVNARLFNVRELPASYFFNKQGNIEATNLHGRTLKLKLDQLFNN